MRKISIFLSATALFVPLSGEAKTEPVPAVEAARPEEGKARLMFREESQNWSLQAGWVRLRPRRDPQTDFVPLRHERKEPSRGVGVLFSLSF